MRFLHKGFQGHTKITHWIHIILNGIRSVAHFILYYIVTENIYFVLAHSLLFSIATFIELSIIRRSKTIFQDQLITINREESQKSITSTNVIIDYKMSIIPCNATSNISTKAIKNTITISNNNTTINNNESIKNDNVIQNNINFELNPMQFRNSHENNDVCVDYTI